MLGIFVDFLAEVLQDNVLVDILAIDKGLQGLRDNALRLGLTLLGLCMYLDLLLIRIFLTGATKAFRLKERFFPLL